LKEKQVSEKESML